MRTHGWLSSGFCYFPKNSGFVIFIVSRIFFFSNIVARLGAHRKKKKNGALQHFRTATCIIHSRHGVLVSLRAFGTSRGFAHATGADGGR